VPAVIVCRTLGPVEVTVNGAMAPGELLWRKHLALLLYLARSGSRGRAREHLMSLLWGESNDSAARHSLNEALRVLRRHAGEGSVDTSAGRVRLLPDVVEIDVDRFAELTGRGAWQAACALISGEFLEGFSVPKASAFEDWLATERSAWRARSVEALVARAEELLRAGDVPEAARLADRALTLDPRSEQALRAAIRSLALAGDRSSALGLYQAYVTRLHDELGAAPSAEVDALADRVRRQRLVRPALAEDPGDSDQARLPLVGRDEELRRLLDAAQAAWVRRRAAALVIVGESGTGKTRLLDELLARLRLDGATVAAARAIDSDRAEPWSGVLALARGGLAEAPGIAAAPPAAVATFLAAGPAWADRFPAAGGVSPMPVAPALRELVAAAAEDAPVVLAVDDAQWLDAESASVIPGGLRDLAAARRVLILAIAGHPPRADLDLIRSRIGRDYQGTAVDLGPLTGAALRSLAARLLPSYDDVELDRIGRRVGTDSAGIPLVAVELLRAVVAGFDLRGQATAWPEPSKTLDQSLPGDLPDALIAAIRIGFRRRSPEAQQVLVAAAVLDERVTPDRLAAATGLGRAAVHTALDELEWTHWLLSESRGYGFVARLVRRVVERDMLTPGQRRRILAADPDRQGAPLA
jgi:DNA-binding SARP family transcriptional activator